MPPVGSHVKVQPAQKKKFADFVGATAEVLEHMGVLRPKLRLKILTGNQSGEVRDFPPDQCTPATKPELAAPAGTGEPPAKKQKTLDAVAKLFPNVGTIA